MTWNIFVIFNIVSSASFYGTVTFELRLGYCNRHWRWKKLANSGSMLENVKFWMATSPDLSPGSFGLKSWKCTFYDKKWENLVSKINSFKLITVCWCFDVCVGACSRTGRLWPTLPENEPHIPLSLLIGALFVSYFWLPYFFSLQLSLVASAVGS